MSKIKRLEWLDVDGDLSVELMQLLLCRPRRGEERSRSLTMASSPCAAITPDCTRSGALCRLVVGKPQAAASGVVHNRLLNGGVVVRVSGLLCLGDAPNASHSSPSSTQRMDFLTYSPSCCMFQEVNSDTGMISLSGGWSQGKGFFMSLKYGPSILPLWWLRQMILARWDPNNAGLVSLIFLKWSNKGWYQI